MATKTLTPTTLYNPNSQISVSNSDNALTDTSSSTYATLTNTTSSTSNRYVYLRGFDFDSIPSSATINSFTIKIKGYYTSGYSQAMSLANGTTAISGPSATSFTTSVQTREFSNSSLTWATMTGYGDNFGIRVNCRRNSRNTQATYYIYGAEIVVDYTVPNPRTITTTLTGSGTIDPSGTETYYDGDTYTLTVTPTNSSDTVTATKNGSSITLTHHAAGTDSISATADSLTTGFSGGTSMAFYTSSSSTGHNFDYAVGHTAESPGSTSSGTGSWTYVKDNGSSTNYTGYADFVFDFSGIPAGSTINSVEVKCYGATESTSESTAHSEITLYSGTTQKSTSQKFTSTSNQTITISSPGTWTRDELQSAKLRFVVGYYGGHIFGITWTVNYTAPEYYSYSYEVSGDATIAVTIGSASVSVTGVSLNKNSTSIEVGSTETLTATVAPSNASNKAVTWSSGNTSVATVNSSGVVTAVSGGTAVITVTTSDGGYTATCTVTVTTPSYKEYTIATTLQAGKSYIIGSGNSGSIYLLSNESAGSGSLAGVSATVSNGVLQVTSTTESKCLFACSLQDNSNQDSTILMTGSNYLYTDSSNRLRIASYTSSMDGKHWHYKADNKNLLWFFKDGTNNDGYTDTSSTYKYYLTLSNGNFADAYVSTTSLSNTTTPEIFLFTEKSDEEDEMYIKLSGSWVKATAVYKKVSGSWVQQTDLTSVFASGTNYKYG